MPLVLQSITTVFCFRQSWIGVDPNGVQDVLVYHVLTAMLNITAQNLRKAIKIKKLALIFPIYSQDSPFQLLSY